MATKRPTREIFGLILVSERGRALHLGRNQGKGKKSERQSRPVGCSILQLDRTFGVILSNPLHRSSTLQTTGCDLSRATQRQQSSQCWTPRVWGTSARTGSRGALLESSPLAPAFLSRARAR